MYPEALGWFRENRHRLSKLKQKVMVTWLRIMRQREREVSSDKRRV